MKKISTRDMILISLFSALTAIGAFIKIPMPVVPFTLQFLFCAYSGIFLGAKYGMYSQALYVGVGLLGIPVFTQGGGPSYILQPTFGFLIGFIVASYVIGNIVNRMQSINFVRVFLGVLSGLFFVYLFGCLYLYMIFNVYMNQDMSLYKAIVVAVLPYIPSDLIVSFIASSTAVIIVPHIKKLAIMKDVEC